MLIMLSNYTPKKMMFFLTFFNSCLACESIFYKKTVFFFSFAQKITFLQCFSTLTQFARVPQIEPSWPQGSGHGASVRGCGKELISFFQIIGNTIQLFLNFKSLAILFNFFKSLVILFNFFSSIITV